MVHPLFDRDIGSEPDRSQAQPVYIGQDKALTNTEAGARLTEQHSPSISVNARPTPTYKFPKKYQHLEFLDRRREMAVAGRALEAGQSVELFGPVGIGKSFLLHHLSSHIPKDIFPAGVLSLTANRQTAADLQQRLFDHFYETSAPALLDQASLRGHLQDKQALILLDDVTAPQEELERLLELVPEATFFMASTQSRPWTSWQTMVVSELPQDDAMRLVERGLGRPLADDELADAEAIIELLGGHPLHILQAVSFAEARGHSLAEVVQQLQETSPDQGLTDMLIEGLTPREREIVGVLAVLGGVALSRDHLAELTGLANLQTSIQALTQQHLIDGEDDHYRLLGSLPETLRQTFDLNESAEQSLAHFINWSETHRHTPAYLLADVEPMIQTMEWAVAKQRWTPVLQLARPLENALFVGMQWGGWERVLRWALQAARASDDEVSEAWALHQLGTRALALNDKKTARNHLETALTIRENLGNQVWIEVTRHNLSFIGDPPMSPPPPPPPSNRPTFSGPGGTPPTGSSPRGNGTLIPAWLQGLAVILIFLVLIFATIILLSRGAGENLLEPLQALIDNESDNAPEAAQQMTSFRIVPDRISFPATEDNQPGASQTVNVINTGEETLVIENFAIGGLNQNDFDIDMDPSNTDPECAQYRVAPGKSCVVRVTRMSNATGAQNAMVEITSNGSVGPYSIPVQAGQSSSLSITPNDFNFGSQLVHAESIPEPVTLTNSGNGNMTIDSVTVTGAGQNQFNFAINNCNRVTLRPGQSCTLSVAFKPDGSGSRSAMLVASINGGNGQYEVPLGGSGAAATPTHTPTPSPTAPVTPTPTITPISSSGTPTPIGTRVPIAAVSPGQINFGSQQEGTTSPVREVLVRNTGSMMLALNSILRTGPNADDFQRSGGSCGGSLNPGFECTIGLTFRPTNAGTRNASLVINHNAAGSPSVVNLLGSGGNQNAALCLSTNRLEFPSQPVGAAGPELTITLTSCGSGSLQIQNITMTDNTADFSEDPARQCRNTTLPTNGRCTIAYQFRPTQTGNRIAIVTIDSNSQNGPQQLELFGVGF